jgi:hypothetical protein
MTADQRDYQSSYRRLTVVAAIAMVGALIPFAIATHKFDQCNQSLQISLDTLKAKVDSAKGAIEKK